MYESLGFEVLTPLAASVGLGLVLGGAYGALAQRSAFCLRRGLVGPWSACRPALGVWVMALATAIAGTRLAVVSGLVSFEAHRFLAPDLPVASALLGGALFGAGMVLAGGCASRLTVLAGAGNLRALLVLIVFAVTALATMRGVLAGSLGAALVAGEFRWESLESPRQTGRYLAGGVMMGAGGVLAGGCTVGAGLSGVSTASLAALLALAAMAASARTAGKLLAGR